MYASARQGGGQSAEMSDPDVRRQASGDFWCLGLLAFHYELAGRKRRPAKIAIQIQIAVIAIVIWGGWYGLKLLRHSDSSETTGEPCAWPTGHTRTVRMLRYLTTRGRRAFRRSKEACRGRLERGRATSAAAQLVLGDEHHDWQRAAAARPIPSTGGRREGS